MTYNLKFNQYAILVKPQNYYSRYIQFRNDFTLNYLETNCERIKRASVSNNLYSLNKMVVSRYPKPKLFTDFTERFSIFSAKILYILCY